MPSIESIKEQYPLHWLAWNNNFLELETVLSKNMVTGSIFLNEFFYFSKIVKVNLIFLMKFSNTKDLYNFKQPALLRLGLQIM